MMRPLVLRRLVTSFILLLTLWSTAFAQERPAGTGVTTTVEVPLVVFNRTVTTFRGSLFGSGPADRARRAASAIRELLDTATGKEVSFRAEPEGHVLLIDGHLAFLIVPDDLDRLSGQTLQEATDLAMAQLRRVMAETAESRDRSQLLRESGMLVLATVVLCLALWGVWFIRGGVVERTNRAAERLARKATVGGAQIVSSSSIRPAVRSLVTAAAWILSAIGVYRWLSFALTQFPYTRPWGEQLRGFFVDTASGMFVGITSAVPGLIVAAIIFALARGVIGLLRPVFDRAASGQQTFTWLDADSARPTQRVFKVAVWLFAFVMAYPYLPGSGSEAFKGITVFLGLMASIGGSSLFGQGASGLILMYSRTLRPGEYVRIGEHEGTVTAMGTYTLRIRTGLGEELTLPNALVLSHVVKNYSRASDDASYVLDTVVTIGYATPWRQVEALLIEAALRTHGVLRSPAPQVFQTALTDFYPEYRLVCLASHHEPRPRAVALAALHANIQDVFNEHGVQIMSPHYLGDPAAPKVVPKHEWYAAPAKPPHT